MNLTEELWQDIPGYEGIYQASNLGQIRTAPGKVTNSVRHGIREWNVRILKGRGDNQRTGKRVTLWRDKKPKDWLVARLVAMVWVTGYEECLTVNHINGDRMDNRASNLEWLTLADNIRHGFNTGLYSSSQKPVIVKNTVTQEEIFFRSRTCAGKFLGKGHSCVTDYIDSNKLIDGMYQIISASFPDLLTSKKCEKTS